MQKIDLSLRPEALQDLEAIWWDGLRRWSERHCEAYLDGLNHMMESLTEFPERFRERIDLEPPVRVAPYRAHIIVYRIAGETVDILRIRHGHEDWTSDL